MTADLFNRYIWLIDTIYSAGRISLEEINIRWARSQYNETRESAIPERTFHRHKDTIKSIFGIDIRCDKTDGNVYYIANADDIAHDGIRKWIVSTFAVNNLIHESAALRNRILFEDIPSGQQFLTHIIRAMRDGRTIEISYRNFRNDTPHIFEVEPYCVKVFRQRWYLVARSIGYDEVRIYGLDRMDVVRTTEQPFSVPPAFDGREYFADSYGIITDAEVIVEKVRLRVSAEQRQYLRSLPLHHSQCETECTDNYSVFEFYLRPTFDFQQAIRSHGTAMEVLSPAWLREQFAKEAENIAKMYRR